MSFNKYNTRTRNSGRYNTPGQFVPGGDLGGEGPMHGGGARGQYQGNYNNYPPPQQQYTPQQQFAPPPPPPQETLQTEDMEMKEEVQADGMEEGAGEGEEGAQRPPWMKKKLGGVKKISNKERRRRQNMTLRRLITPKNALMALNEMVPNEQVANQFKVESAGYFQPQNANNFCADLTVEGQSYKGYGENKISARNAAAEQAFRDLILKRLAKVTSDGSAGAAGAADAGGAGGAANGDGAGEDETLPMIQLASFALHKLFSEWEYEGHKVPQLKASATTSVSESGEVVMTPAGGRGARGPKPPKPPAAPRTRAQLPANAAQLHPCMLLTYMRPRLEWRDLAQDGDTPQNISYTIGVDVDGATYIGKAHNKKEARRLAAKSACSTLFGVQFEPEANANVPRPVTN